MKRIKDEQVVDNIVIDKDLVLKLSSNKLYIQLQKNCDKEDKEILSLIEKAVTYSCKRIKTIIRHMGQYTLHDEDHLFRVLKIMELLIPEAEIPKLSTPELMLLILSAFFHDIGMAPEEKDVLAWRKIWDAKPTFEDENEKKEYLKFSHFTKIRHKKLSLINNFNLKKDLSSSDLVKDNLIAEYIRTTHADRAREIIERHWKEKIKFRTNDITAELAQICHSHNEDAMKVINFDMKLLCASEIYACLPLVAILLRLSDILDFDSKRTPEVLFSNLYIRNPISLIEWNKHRSIDAWEINSKNIIFSAKCSHPAIEYSIHKFIDIMDGELGRCNNLLQKINIFNKNIKREINIIIPFQVERKVKTKTDISGKARYTYKETSFTLSKNQVVDLLMGTKLYGNPDVALRELIQNSIDACLLRKSMSKSWGTNYSPKIIIKYNEENGDHILVVEDNGIGMDQNIIDNYYSKIGSSFYKSSEFDKLKADSNSEFIPTSRFGIGILSTFMVSDSLTVDTKKVYEEHRSSDSIKVVVEGQDSIFWFTKGSRRLPGTTTTLILRDETNPWKRMTEEGFIKSVESVIPNPPFTFEIQTSLTKSVRDEKSFSQFKSSDLKDYKWDEHENIRFIDIDLLGETNGISGSATIAILESHGVPQKRIQLNNRDIEIEGETFTLERNLEVSENEISDNSKTITINEEGDISLDDSFSSLARSNGKISLHGIEIPTELFQGYWNRNRNLLYLKWPLPLLLVVDVCGTRDLDLNSARTEIISSDKWADFEENLAFLIFSRIKEKVEEEYWQKLESFITTESKNDNFINGINKINKNNT